VHQIGLFTKITNLIVHLFRSLVNFFSIQDRLGLRTMKFLIMQYFSDFPSLCLSGMYSLPARSQTHLRSSYTHATLSVRDQITHTYET